MFNGPCCDRVVGRQMGLQVDLEGMDEGPGVVGDCLHSPLGNAIRGALARVRELWDSKHWAMINVLDRNVSRCLGLIVFCRGNWKFHILWRKLAVHWDATASRHPDGFFQEGSKGMLSIMPIGKVHEASIADKPRNPLCHKLVQPIDRNDGRKGKFVWEDSQDQHSLELFAAVSIWPNEPIDSNQHGYQSGGFM